ncbi:hypothetical protein AB4Y45_33550 [Paraburkholderia sp. EG287A]|uniref:hypothetical protein n=1 Tax=Paraburkholderia sp. EG287A TaxID=3237012 RepID=UPI0034D23A7E
MDTKARIGQILAYLKEHAEPGATALLAMDPKPQQDINAHTNVGAVLLASGQFEVEGFSVTPAGVRWGKHLDDAGWLHPYFYLATFLGMGSDELTLLFGPRCLNDHMMHQFEPMPKTDHALLVARLEHYLREGTPVCNL